MQPLQPNSSYHIFNHANGFENIFLCSENFKFFLRKYVKYINPIAETYAYCLMPNHFHLVVRIKKRAVIERLIVGGSSNNYSKFNFSKVTKPFESASNVNNSSLSINDDENFGKVIELNIDNQTTTDKEIELFLSKQFSNLFSCYTQSFNKVYKRRGSLFIKNFHRKVIDDKTHFINEIIYTHRNPVHHQFTHHFSEWEYSSFNAIVAGDSAIVATDKLLKIFGNLNMFEQQHENNLHVLMHKLELECN